MGGSLGKPSVEKIYAAVDFGTVNTGFAIHLPNYPDVQVRLFENADRIPSIVLLDENKKFVAFGHTAKTQFCAMTKEEQDKHYFYQLYKLQLVGSNMLSSTATIVDFSKKKSMKTLALFTIIFRHLTERSFQKLTDANMANFKDNVNWIITVPTIWSHSAREFMRQAALNAGITENNVRLVLEPEAAALSSRQQLLNGKPKGFRYILADMGGGTVDICAHELLGGGQIKELCRSMGGCSGGKSVDNKFEAFMVSLFGGEVWTNLKEDHANIYMDIMNEFEEQKRQFSTATSVTVLRVEPVLLNLLRETNEGHNELQMVIPETKYADSLTFNVETSRLTLTNSIMETFFNDSIEKVIVLIGEVVNECRSRKLPMNTLILAGGYSESPYVREKIANEFAANYTVLQEPDPRNVVARGAVLIGKTEKNFIQRIAKVCYGMEQLEEFNGRKHKETYKRTIGDTSYCSRFGIVIRKGDLLTHGKTFSYISKYRKPGTTEFLHPRIVYLSEENNPSFCCEEGMVAKIDIGSPNSPGVDNHTLRYDVVVDDIELVFKITNLTTHRLEGITVRYLND